MDLIGFDRYVVTIHGPDDMQELDVINGEEATEIASRMRSFLRGSYQVTLTGVLDGEATFDEEGEYRGHVNGKSELIAF